MKPKISACALKVFISAISIVVFFPFKLVFPSETEEAIVFSSERFISIFVYLLGRFGETVIPLIDSQESSKHIIRNTFMMILNSLAAAVSAAFSWNTDIANNSVVFWVLYSICGLSLVCDISDLVSASYWEIHQRGKG